MHQLSFCRLAFLTYCYKLEKIRVYSHKHPTFITRFLIVIVVHFLNSEISTLNILNAKDFFLEVRRRFQPHIWDILQHIVEIILLCNRIANTIRNS